jgi:peptidoglycan/LPS O-acetylase OafA/YrhL
MYVLLPVVFFFVRKNFSLWPLLVLWGFTIMNCRTTPVMDQSFAVAIGYFLPGVMAYVGFSRWKPVLPAWLLLVALPILWAAFWYRPNFHRGWYFCLAIGLGLPLFRQLKSPALLGPSRVIARYSYGIYLLHPLAIAIGFYVLRYQAAWVQWSALVVSVVALPLAAYHLVELPLIRLGSRLAAHAEKRYEQLDGKQYRQVHTVS